MSRQHLSGRVLGATILTISLPILLATGGCISRGAYQENIGRLNNQIQTERALHAQELAKYDKRLRDKNDTVVKLTERYMALQERHAVAQGKLDSLKDDLETLLKDIAELKMVVFHNVKGSEGNEMIIKLMEMQHRVKTLLRNETANQ